MKKSLLILSLALSAGHAFAQAQNPPTHPPIGGQPPQPPIHGQPLPPVACLPPFCNLTELTEAASSVPFNTPVNTRFQISLPDNSGSTGYVWTWTDDSSTSIVKHLGNGTCVPDDLSDNNDLLGSSTAKKFWRFKTMTPGRTVLTFSLARPWEQEPIQQISFTIVVQPNDNIPQPPSAQ